MSDRTPDAGRRRVCARSLSLRRPRRRGRAYEAAKALAALKWELRPVATARACSLLLFSFVGLLQVDGKILSVDDLGAVNEDAAAREQFVREHAPIAHSILQETPAKPTNVVFQVVDQDGKPVPDAEFRFYMEAYRFLPERTLCQQAVTLKTDATGQAQTRLVPMRMFAFSDAWKPGYEFRAPDNPLVVHPHDAYNPDETVAKFWQRILTSSRTDAFVITIRQRGKLTLYSGQQDYVRFPFDGEGKVTPEQMLPLLMPWGKGRIPWAGALVVTARYDVQTNAMLFTVRTADGKGGVLVADKELREAPETGYLPEITFQIPRGAKPPKVLPPPFVVYCRTGTPLLYGSVLFLRFLELDDSRQLIGVRFDTNVNLYGGRAVEPMRPGDLPVEKRSQFDKLQGDLLREARGLLANGKLPPDPDLHKVLGLPLEN